MSALSQLSETDRLILACCIYSEQKVTEDVLKSIFRLLGLKLSGMRSFLNFMETLAIIVPRNELCWPERVSIPPKTQFELLTDLTDTETERALDACRQLRPGYASFSSAFSPYWRFLLAIKEVLRGKSVDATAIGTCTDKDCDQLYTRIDPLLGIIFSDSRFAALLNVLPVKILSTFIRRHSFALHRGELTFYDPLKFAARLCSDDASVDTDSTSLFEFAVLFPQLGHPEERMTRMSPTSYCFHVLSAVAALGRNDSADALVSLKKGLRCLPGQTRIFPDSFSNFIYGAALYCERRLISVQKSIRSLDSFISGYEEDCYALKVFLGYAASAETGTRAYLRAENPAYKPLTKCQIFRRLAGQALGIKDENLATVLQNSDDPKIAFLGRANALPVWMLQYESVDSPESEQYRNRCAELGMERLIPRLTAQTLWESRLDELIERQCRDVEYLPVRLPPSGKEIECLTYSIDTGTFEVAPRLRKTKDGGMTFSRGTAYRFADLQNAKASSITLQDRVVIKTALTGKSVIPRLIGHPYLFDAADLSHRLKIVRTPIKVTVTEEPDGFHIGFNVKVSNSFEGNSAGSWYVYDDADTIRVISCTAAQAAILVAFNDPKMKLLPLAARVKLTQLLEVMSANMTVSSSLLNDAEFIEKRTGDSRITFRLRRTDSCRFAADACVRPGPGVQLVKPGYGSECLSGSIDGVPLQITRDLKAETANANRLLKKISVLEDCRTTTWHWDLDTAECLTLLDALRGDETVILEWPEGEVFSVKHRPIDFSSLHLSVSRIGEWLAVEGKVVLDSKASISVAELLRRIQESEGDFIRLGDKEYVALTAALRRELASLSESAQKSKKRGRSTGFSLSVFHVGMLADLEDAGAEMKADEAFRALLDRMKDAGTLDPLVPKGLKAELRDYQLEGFRWMSRLAAWGAGSILADDMGLGKTVQAIALLLDRAHLGPQLVVMPTAVLVNWEHELARFAPSLSIRVFNREDRAELVKSVKEGDVVLTSYGVLSSEIELLQGVAWQTAVLDEAHTVKNRTTKTSKAVMALQAECRVLLTGTPLQNRLAEIWNLFQFANPGLLGTYDNFAERFITPIETHKDKAVQKALKRIVSPFILRRTKAEVLDELPQKTELTIRVTLSDKERALYESLREHASTSLETGEINPIQALAELTKLRQAACHPELVNPKLKLASSKTAAFLDLVAELRESGHRSLVFSQFTSHLALVKRELDMAGIPFLYLDGSDSAAKRSQLVEEFQHGDMPLFLISLKAGGTGLNLTAADYVIHLDPWWNPAIENQASDRAYRIGQDRPVTIYRLIAEDTIEEKILRLHETKKSLADALLEGTDMSARLSKDEILALLAGA